MPVEVSGTAAAKGIDRRALRRKARSILEAIGRRASELSVVLVDDDGIRRLNRDWRGKDRATDVLSFPLQEGEFAGVGDALGDVVISLPTARRQAAENGFTIAEEVDRLLIHGILHLVGYDHEVSPREARRMQRQERKLRALLEHRDGAGRRRSRAPGPPRSPKAGTRPRATDRNPPPRSDGGKRGKGRA